MQQIYKQSINQTVKELHTDAQKGLSAEEAKNRQLSYGLNQFDEQKQESLIKKILHHISDISTIILLVAAILSFALAVREGHGFIEPTVIIIIIGMNLTLAVTQERSAERALNALSKLNSPTCQVIRDNSQQEVSTIDLVPGDLIVLKTGVLVPADARLISSNNLAVDESSLTGESEPSEKNSDLLLQEDDIPLGDQNNMLFSGCLVTAGNGTAVVTTTGMHTEIGKIAGYLNQEQKYKTPLQIRLDRVGKIISFIAIVSAALIFALGAIQGKDFWQMALLAVTLAVAAVPETLSLIVTLTLTQGVKNMVTKNALIRKLPAVETLGSTSIICSDKTGTLTQNKMILKRLWHYGADSINEGDTFSEDYSSLLKKFSLASTAVVSKDENGNQQIIGDPTESAIVALLVEKGIDQKQLTSDYPKVFEIPFSSERKMMTVVVEDPRGGYLVLTKGAFDRIPIRNQDQNYLKEVEDIHDSFALDAMRVIGLAGKHVDQLPPQEDIAQIESNLILEGFVGIIDPPRPEAAQAIAHAKRAGIRTIMITGDHAATAGAIARQLGIITANEGVITGPELAHLSSEELADSIEFYSVYARVSPEDKIRIVEAWQTRGDVVSMTGDGVNDAPALKAADVGIAMGINGTDVAKSASDMVLTDDNFATILDSVNEGRNVFSNIRKTIYFLVVCNISEIIIMLVAQTLRWEAPVTPMMLLLINVIGDGIPGLALAKEISDPRIMKRKPIGRNESFFSGGLLEVIIQQIIAFSLVTLAGYYIGTFVELSQGDAPSHLVGQTMAFLILGWTSIIHVLTVRSRKSIFTSSIKKSKQLFFSAGAMLIVFTALVAIPQTAGLLGFSALSLPHWLIAIGLSIIPTIVAEYEKIWEHHKARQEQSHYMVHYRHHD